ncbi:MAG: NAD-dependent succinate-semialdehyde dehydrogenase [Candidatus Dormibacteraeota bacterium]|nr:NAD-dependent succinate-semialdehyde dehydrogenase [Candidatus Dormibacteraeota bacterium]
MNSARQSALSRIDTRLYINGDWTEAAAGERFDVTDPGTREVVGSAALGRRADAVRALEAAGGAFPSWSRESAYERGRILRRAADLIRERAGDIAVTLTREQGKPLPDSRKEILFGADVIEYYAEEGKRIKGEWLTPVSTHTRSLVLRQPVGVVVAIVPWNYPVDLLTWKIGPALAAGCTVVAKPPSETPLAVSEVVQCFADAGLPAGALNMVTGSGREVGEELVANPLSRKITVTGSTATGRRVMELAARHVKRLTLELGGQSPIIICRDADLDVAVPAAARRSFSNMGQICIAVNRIYADKQISNDFTNRLVEYAGGLKLGYGLDPGVEYGPMLNEEGREQTRRHVRDALGHGATLLYGGREPEGDRYSRGYYYLPTVLSDVTPEMRVMREETFGPIAPVAMFEELDQALLQANSTPYGLAAYLYTRDLPTALYAAERLEAGGVGININDVTELGAPFGGWKESGFGRELGHEGIDACLETKHIRIGGL